MILLMIVKDEADHITRALDSAHAAGISRAVILDTGSADDTMKLALGHRGVEVLLHQTKWYGFAHARATVMRYARKHYPDDFGIMLDADDTIAELNAPGTDDAYKVVIRYADILYDRVCVFKLCHEWEWRGVVHEYPVVDGMQVGSSIGAIVVGGGGARSRDPQKYLHDADLINTELMHEPDQDLRNRYCFYLAQSYRDANHSGAAIYWYEQVIKANGWAEEQYVACLNLARLTGSTDWYQKAAAINPKRAEAWRALGNHGMADRCVPDAAHLFTETQAYGTRT